MSSRVVRFQDIGDEGKSSGEEISLSIESLRFEPGMSFHKFIQEKHRRVDDDGVGEESIFSVQELVQRITWKNPRGFHTKLKCPPRYDEMIWLTEIMRQLVIDLNHLVGRLGEVCSCEEMITTDEQTFLCAAHSNKNPRDCGALEYSAHTVDAFTTKLHNLKLFPSRIKTTPQGQKQLKQYARRLFRILAHVYYHHKDLWREEGKWECWRLYLVSEKLSG